LSPLSWAEVVSILIIKSDIIIDFITIGENSWQYNTIPIQFQNRLLEEMMSDRASHLLINCIQMKLVFTINIFSHKTQRSMKAIQKTRNNITRPWRLHANAIKKATEVVYMMAFVIRQTDANNDKQLCHC